MKIKLIPSILIIIFCIIFLIFYKGLQNSNVYVPKNNIEIDIPAFNAKLFDTYEEILSEEIFKTNEFYFMNIWSSWCIPCREEHQFLINLGSQENIEIIGLNYKDKNANAKKFLKEFNNPFKLIVSDIDGTIAIEWGAIGVPESFLIYNKKIIKKIVGPLDENSLLEIKKIIQ
jgi:cytochrome c biogenesis protein CcmG, thiol:disulfide interchange protein DsbE